MQKFIYEVTIYLRSGSSFVFHVANISIKYNPDGSLNQLKWKTPDDDETNRYTGLKFIDLSDVSAITMR